MVDISSLLAFVLAASVLTLTPGVDTAIVLRALATGGRRQALQAATGIAMGCLAWGAAASLGLGALLHASQTAYTVVKLVGGAYLVWLGVKLLLASTTQRPVDPADAGFRPQANAFWQGLLTNLLNPKIGIFYVTFLPQFIAPGAHVAGYSFFLAGVHVALSLLWFGMLIAAAAPLGALLRRPDTAKTLDRLTGCIFVGFGVRLASSAPGLR